METWAEIRRRVLVEKVNRRQILRETGMHWRTLAKIQTTGSCPATSGASRNEYSTQQKVGFQQERYCQATSAWERWYVMEEWHARFPLVPLWRSSQRATIGANKRATTRHRQNAETPIATNESTSSFPARGLLPPSASTKWSTLTGLVLAIAL
jgi:hypothetical protein